MISTAQHSTVDNTSFSDSLNNRSNNLNGNAMVIFDVIALKEVA